MATTNTSKEILSLERQYWDAMMTKDPDVATRLTADKSIVVGAQGVGVVSRKEIGSMVQSDAWKLKKYEFDNVELIEPDEKTAVIAYSVKEELEVDGKTLTLEANDSTLWIRQNGHWVCMLHTETLKGDPFGRDRIH